MTTIKNKTAVRSVRMPEQVLHEITTKANKSERSVNREIVFHLKRSLNLDAEKSAA